MIGLSYQDRMTPAIRLLAFRLRKGLSIPNELTFGVHDQFILDLFLERLQQFQMTFQFFLSTNFDCLDSQGWPNHFRGQKSAHQDIFKCPLNFFENFICYIVLRILKQLI